MSINLEPTIQQIGIIHSCFKEKFGIPRQAGLVTEAKAELEILSPYDREEAFRGLTEFSHIWILFIFHAINNEWKTCVRPPRLGGNKKIGVFATRSGFRPNNIGLSAVKLKSIVKKKNKIIITIKGGDFLDQTPVLDIKPYLPYADKISKATGGFASEAPTKKNEVEFTPDAYVTCREKEKSRYPYLQKLITQILENDPRPAYYSQKPSRNIFGMKIYDIDVKWKISKDKIIVFAITNCHSP